MATPVTVRDRVPSFLFPYATAAVDYLGRVGTAVVRPRSVRTVLIGNHTASNRRIHDSEVQHCTYRTRQVPNTVYRSNNTPKVRCRIAYCNHFPHTGVERSPAYYSK